MPEHEKSTRAPPSLLDFIAQKPDKKKKKGKQKNALSREDGCNLADVPCEDVNEKMAKMIVEDVENKAKDAASNP